MHVLSVKNKNEVIEHSIRCFRNTRIKNNCTQKTNLIISEELNAVQMKIKLGKFLKSI